MWVHEKNYGIFVQKALPQISYAKVPYELNLLLNRDLIVSASQPAPSAWTSSSARRPSWTYSSGAISCLPLAVSRVDAIRSLREQVQEGNALSRLNICSREDLNRLQRDHFRWAEKNESLLLDIFESEKVARDYMSFATRSYPCGVPSLEAESRSVQREIATATDRLRQIMQGITLSLERGLEARSKTGKISILKAPNPFAAELPVTASTDVSGDSMYEIPSWALTLRPFIGTLVIHSETSSRDKDLCGFLDRIGMRYSWMNLLRKEDMEASGPVSLGPLLPSFILIVIPDPDEETQEALRATLNVLSPLCSRIPRERIAFLGRASTNLERGPR